MGSAFLQPSSLLLLLLPALLVLPSTTALNDGDRRAFPWSDRSLPPARRAELLLAEMSLREKINYLGGGGYKHGNLYSGGNAPIPRLGVPQLNMNDGRAGYRVLPTPAPAPPSAQATGPLPGLILIPLQDTPVHMPVVLNGSAHDGSGGAARQCEALCHAARNASCKAWVATPVGGCALAPTTVPHPVTLNASQHLCWLKTAFPTAVEHSDCAISGVQAGAPRGGASEWDGVRLNGGSNTPGTSTLFPSGLTAAATWDPELIYEWGKAMGREVRSKGAGMFLCPAASVIRLPQGGRNGESLAGEDPVLGR